jgi:hypothetical protein
MAKQTKKWITATGEKIRLCDMSDTYLTNIFRFLERKAVEFHEAAIDNASFMFSFVQGDMASCCAESALDDAFDKTPSDYLPPIFQSVVDELERRKIKISSQL